MLISILFPYLSSLLISYRAYEGSLHCAGAVAALPTFDAIDHCVQQAARS
jgi:hypothetical protein